MDLPNQSTPLREYQIQEQLKHKVLNSVLCQYKYCSFVLNLLKGHKGLVLTYRMY